jgi:hypothetical protein
MTSFKTDTIVSEYEAVLDSLDAGAFWARKWAARQYVGLVLTAMCIDLSPDVETARRCAVMRVMQVFLEQLHNLAPVSEDDIANPRRRVEMLAVPGQEAASERWIDVLELLQLRNWLRKKRIAETIRIEELRGRVTESFSAELLEEVEESTEEWWIH